MNSTDEISSDLEKIRQAIQILQNLEVVGQAQVELDKALDSLALLDLILRAG